MVCIAMYMNKIVFVCMFTDYSASTIVEYSNI